MINKKKLFAAMEADWTIGCSDDCLSEYIAEEYEKVSESMEQIKLLEKERIKALRDMEEETTRIKEAVWDVRNNCVHWTRTYYPDASGNNDSETICDICGESL